MHCLYIWSKDTQRPISLVMKGSNNQALGPRLGLFLKLGRWVQSGQVLKTVIGQVWVLVLSPPRTVMQVFKNRGLWLWNLQFCVSSPSLKSAALQLLWPAVCYKDCFFFIQDEKKRLFLETFFKGNVMQWPPQTTNYLHLLFCGNDRSFRGRDLKTSSIKTQSTCLALYQEQQPCYKSGNVHDVLFILETLRGADLALVLSGEAVVHCVVGQWLDCISLYYAVIFSIPMCQEWTT